MIIRLRPSLRGFAFHISYLLHFSNSIYFERNLSYNNNILQTIFKKIKNYELKLSSSHEKDNRPKKSLPSIYFKICWLLIEEWISRK